MLLLIAPTSTIEQQLAIGATTGAATEQQRQAICPPLQTTTTGHEMHNNMPFRGTNAAGPAQNDKAEKHKN